MTTTSAIPHPPKPRKRPQPSPRDREIYAQYQLGKRQAELAEAYRLTQCRISQIVRRVESWLAAGSAGARRLERQLEREQLSFVCRQAIRHFQEPQKCVTHKKGTRGDKAFDETTERTLPANVQYLKTVLQTTRELSRLEEKPPLEEAADDAAMREQVEEWLTKEYDEAARAGKVSGDIYNRAVIGDLVKALLGEPNSGVYLHVLARDANKKIRDRKPYDDSHPPLPRKDGWYAAVHDEDGDVVGWRPADAETGDIAVKGCGGGGGGVAVGGEADHGDSRADDGDRSVENRSAEHAAVRCATHSHPAESACITTCAATGPSPQPAATEELAAEAAEQRKLDRAWDHPPPPDKSDRLPGENWPACFDDPDERRWRHHQRLEKFREMKRKGWPCMFTFYREDGPLP